MACLSYHSLTCSTSAFSSPQGVFSLDPSTVREAYRITIKETETGESTYYGAYYRALCVPHSQLLVDCCLTVSDLFPLTVSDLFPLLAVRVPEGWDPERGGTGESRGAFWLLERSGDETNRDVEGPNAAGPVRHRSVVGVLGA